MTGKSGFALAMIVAAGVWQVSAASAEDRRVRIINETNHTIERFYASNIAQESWEEDILGKDVLEPGQDVTIDIDDGSGRCKFDFKAEFDDGTSLVRKNINVCEISSYRYTE